MKFLYGFLLLVFMAPLAQSLQESTFEGLFYKSSGRYYFKDTAKQKLMRLIPNDRFIQQDLARLDSGDSLTGSGFIDSENNILHISSIHFVGLSKMLGVWRTEGFDIFEFIDFNKFNIYQVDRGYLSSIAKTLNYRPVKSYQYSVAPNSKENWSILINDNQTINIGKLEVSNSIIEIDFYDPDTGKINKTLTLKRTF